MPHLRRLKSVPKGFRLVSGATTAPLGFRLFTSRKLSESRFRKRKTPTRFVLVRKK